MEKIREHERFCLLADWLELNSNQLMQKKKDGFKNGEEVLRMPPLGESIGYNGGITLILSRDIISQ